MKGSFVVGMLGLQVPAPGSLSRGIGSSGEANGRFRLFLWRTIEALCF